MAKILSFFEDSLREAASVLRAGGLVAFPTETVYGLGAHAFDAQAVAQIFLAKGRPLTDPLIVHVPSAQDAQTLVDLSPPEQAIFSCLGSAFWPGPLTLVARAASQVPPSVTAGGASVGVRVPAHPVALALLQAAQCPVAAPSANLFGHVSPTCAAHVNTDLGFVEGLLILDGGPCGVGIESTVAKIVSSKKLVVLRRGAISTVEIEMALVKAGLSHVQIEVFENKTTEVTQTQEAPGQLVTHYAPNIETFMLRYNGNESHGNEKAIEMVADAVSGISIAPLKQSVLIDLGGDYKALQSKVLAYRDLSEGDNPKAAAELLFATLRWAECIPQAQVILLPDVKVKILAANNKLTDQENKQKEEVRLAIFDRIFRASSGRWANII